ncbi:MAG: hypothetical protein GYA33_08625 [Thermogutta sp.]|nr:hypothetical protein [Thermogutta sp.]
MMAQMKTLLGSLLMVAAALAVGCSKGEAVKPVERNPKEILTQRLQDVASGKMQQLGSAFGEIMNLIEEIKKTDAALGASLEEDGKALMSGTNPAGAKEIAQRMLQKLEAAPAPAAGS